MRAGTHRLMHRLCFGVALTPLYHDLCSRAVCPIYGVCMPSDRALVLCDHWAHMNMKSSLVKRVNTNAILWFLAVPSRTHAKGPRRS
eukprot:5846091-Prymnesium_polylepis.1